MEFSSRGFQRSTQPAATSTNVGGPTDPNKPVTKKTLQKIKMGRPFSLLFVCLLVSVVILIVALILWLSTKSVKSEASYVDPDNYQVIALVDKQAYFGKISAINSRYVVLYDVYYIQDNGSAQDVNSTNTSSTLVKRGCEIHKPQDQMVISRDQVNFWENLQSDGQVAKAIKQWQNENKDGQKCTNQSSQSSATQNQATDSTAGSGTDATAPDTATNDSSTADTSTKPPSSSTSNTSDNTSTIPSTGTGSNTSN